MIWEYFYALGGGRHVGNSHGAMMRLRHNLVIGKFCVDGGGRISFLEVVNGSSQRPCVGRSSTIDGRVIMFRFQWRRNKTIRITKIHISFKQLQIIKINWFCALILVAMLSFIFVILVLAPSDILFGRIFNVYVGGLGTLEAGVGSLLSVGVAVVDAWAIPWSGCTPPGSLSVCPPPP